MTVEIFKTLVIGPANVGKSSLVRRYHLGEFRESYVATIGVDMKIAAFELPEGKVVLTLFDLGGQETFFNLRNRFFEGANHMLIVYDMTDRKSYEVIPKWHKTLCQSICLPSNQFLGGSLVANKKDLEDNRVVSAEEGELLAGLLQLDYFETSAKTGENVSELFIAAARTAKQRRDALVPAATE